VEGHRSGQLTARLRPGADTDAKCRHLLGQLKSHATKQIFNKLRWPGPRRWSLCGVIVQGLLLKIPRPFRISPSDPARHTSPWCTFGALLVLKAPKVHQSVLHFWWNFPNFSFGSSPAPQPVVHFWCTFGAKSAKSAPVTGALLVLKAPKKHQKCTGVGALLVHFRCTFGAL